MSFSHRTNLLRALNLDPTTNPSRETVAAALLQITDAIAFESLATSQGCCVAALRSFESWDASAQGQDAAQRYKTEGAVVVEQDGNGDGTRPAWIEGLGGGIEVASGVRVLEMTRVIAGPVGGRTMAGQFMGSKMRRADQGGAD